MKTLKIFNLAFPPGRPPRIAGESVEHLLLFTPAGVPLLEKAGAADQVALASDELALLPGQVLLHNHPGVPQSFSVEDVHLAVWHDLAEMHAVDRLYRYRLVRPADALWGPQVWTQQVAPRWQAIEQDVTQRLDQARERGLLEQDQYDVLREHLIWTELNAAFNIGYSRAPRKIR